MIKRFNRFELKYLATASQAAALKEDLLLRMRLDDHGAADGGYAITSLYYDSPDLVCMRAKFEGIKFRRKLRIRRYDESDGGTVFVEIKQRINRTTQKRRLVLPLEQAYALCAGQSPAREMDAADTAAAEEVCFLVKALSLQPTCLIGYRREALVGGPYEPGLRVTFDHSIWAAADQRLDSAATRHQLLPPSFKVLEVKANDAVPLWLANALARHQCELRRYSKYCIGATKLGQLELLQTTIARDIWMN